MGIYVGDLITEVRRDTDNVSFSATSGISTEDFLRQMNYARQRLQALLIQHNCTLFRRSVDFNVTATQDAYIITDNVYLKESIVNVKYSRTGQEADFVDLREIGESYRSFDTSSSIAAYSRRGGSIIVSPIPNVTQGKLRVVYDRALDMLDIRRGTIDAQTQAGGSLSANTLSLDIGSDDDARITGSTSATDKYFCCVNKDGIVSVYNVAYTAYATGTGNFTHEAKAVESGATLAVGDFVTIGQYRTTHNTIIDSPSVERYLQLYCAVKIFRRDSSSDSIEAARELKAVEDEIVETFQGITKDESDIQISDPDVLLLGPDFGGKSWP